jgi:NAD(P)-dependent dehydrogenase (short-subunit alcohol dehydrogenase family)
LTFAGAGADIIIGDMLDADAHQTCEKIRALGRKATYIPVDVCNPEQMEKLFNAAASVDIAINAAGVTMTDHFIDANEKDIRRIFDINIMGSNNFTQSAMRRMIVQKHGKLLLIASVAAKVADVTVVHYRMSKAAVLSLTMSAARIGALHNINVNALCPGVIRTAMWEHLLDGKSIQMNLPREEVWKRMVTNLIPMNRPQSEEDIANAAAFLCSEMARNITGQSLNVDGGQCMQL